MKLDEGIFTEQVAIDGCTLETLMDVDYDKYCDLMDGFENSLQKTMVDDEEENVDVWEKFASGLMFNLINVDGVLYQALLEYYGSKEKLLERVRGAVFVDVDIDRFLVWQRGLGYNIIDADLLDGDGSGETIKKFLKKINQ